MNGTNLHTVQVGYKDGLKALNKTRSYKQTLFNSLFLTEDFVSYVCAKCPEDSL